MPLFLLLDHMRTETNCVDNQYFSEIHQSIFRFVEYFQNFTGDLNICVQSTLSSYLSEEFAVLRLDLFTIGYVPSMRSNKGNLILNFVNVARTFASALTLIINPSTLEEASPIINFLFA